MAEDARISTALPSHPKTKKLHRRLGDHGCWSLVCLFLWVAGNRWDGNLSGLSVEDIELAAEWAGEPGAFVKALTEVRFLEGSDGAFLVHDWVQHNPWAAARGQRIQTAKDNAARRWGGGRPEEGGSSKRESDRTRSQRLAEARAKGTHSADDWLRMLQACGHRCVKCSAEGSLVKDHIVPIYAGGSDAIDNLQPLCRTCNSSKGPDDTDYRPTGWREMLLSSAGSLPNDSEMSASGRHLAQETPAPNPTQPNPTQTEPPPPPTRRPENQNLAVGGDFQDQLLVKAKELTKTYPMVAFGKDQELVALMKVHDVNLVAAALRKVNDGDFAGVKNRIAVTFSEKGRLAAMIAELKAAAKPKKIPPNPADRKRRMIAEMYHLDPFSTKSDELTRLYLGSEDDSLILDLQNAAVTHFEELRAEMIRQTGGLNPHQQKAQTEYEAAVQKRIAEIGGMIMGRPHDEGRIQ